MWFRWQREVNQKLDVLTAMVQQLIKEQQMDISALTTEIANNTTVTASVESLLANLTAEIATISSGSTDAATQTALNALVATLQANDAGISAAVVANTPAAPAPAPAPAPASGS